MAHYDTNATTSSHADSEAGKSSGRPLLQKLKDKTKDTGHKLANPKKTLGRNTRETERQHVLEQLDNNAAFNPYKLIPRTQYSFNNTAAKIVGFFQAIGETVADPSKSFQDKATKATAAKLAKSKPHISRKADLEFLEAHDNLRDAKSSHSSHEHGEDGDWTDEQLDEEFHAKEDDLKANRESMRVAWITSRHMKRVRVVDRTPEPFPDKSTFVKEDDQGRTKFDWGKWIAHRLLHGSRPFTAQYVDDLDTTAFSLDTLRKNVERLILVSGWFQSWVIGIRSIYRWEDPKQTAICLAMYSFFWYIDHLGTLLWAFIIYRTVHNLLSPCTFDQLRNSIGRTLDRGKTAMQISELVDQHGEEDWLHPLIDELGPWIQVQLDDLTNLLEICYNFYQWKVPSKTLCTLGLFSVLLLISLLGDATFCYKLAYFIMGFIFFGCWPIASLYPKYRLLVSPIRWGFWDVPTHGEWACLYLRQHSLAAKQLLASRNQQGYSQFSTTDKSHRPVPTVEGFESDESDSDSDAASFTTATSTIEDTLSFSSDIDILSFRCIYALHPGRLILSTTSLRFQSTSPRSPSSRTKFHIPYSNLKEMRKLRAKKGILSPAAKYTSGLDRLELRFWTARGDVDGGGMAYVRSGPGGGKGEEEEGEGEGVVLLENMRGRDKAFNAILGFSGLEWQVLQRHLD